LDRRCFAIGLKGLSPRRDLHLRSSVLAKYRRCIMKPKGKSEFAEKLYTIKEAAPLLGLGYLKLQRAVQQGLVPSHTLDNSRKRLRLSEIIAVIERSRSGGADA
jgi:hypothetical protein